MLAQKDAEEAAALEDLRAQARKELSEWYSRSDDQLNQTKISNRWGGGLLQLLGLCFYILVNFWTSMVENCLRGRSKGKEGPVRQVPRLLTPRSPTELFITCYNH